MQIDKFLEKRVDRQPSQIMSPLENLNPDSKSASPKSPGTNFLQIHKNILTEVKCCHCIKFKKFDTGFEITNRKNSEYKFS